MQQHSFKDYEIAAEKIDFKVVPYASVKGLKYSKVHQTKISYKKEHNEDFLQADLTFRIGSRSQKKITLPEVRPCPTPKQCLLPQDKVFQLYQLFKYIPDIDEEFMKCMFYEYRNKPPNRKKKTKQKQNSSVKYIFISSF
ncbi:hypothetical protein JTB14_018527 [Gonioctena quinquepunctata]|nr:hypothetical protein JTB14_018527 [Gonioctena quinquepunctata]